MPAGMIPCSDHGCPCYARRGHSTCIGHDPEAIRMRAIEKKMRVSAAECELNAALAACGPPGWRGLDRLAAAIKKYQETKR